MTTRTQSNLLFRNRNARKERMLQRMAAMRAAKERKRLANRTDPADREPKCERYHPLELGLRDRRTGEVAWVPLISIRDAVRRLRVVREYYANGRL